MRHGLCMFVHLCMFVYVCIELEIEPCPGTCIIFIPAWITYFSFGYFAVLNIFLQILEFWRQVLLDPSSLPFCSSKEYGDMNSNLTNWLPPKESA